MNNSFYDFSKALRDFGCKINGESDNYLSFTTTGPICEIKENIKEMTENTDISMDIIKESQSAKMIVKLSCLVKLLDIVKEFYGEYESEEAMVVITKITELYLEIVKEA